MQRRELRVTSGVGEGVGSGPGLRDSILALSLLPLHSSWIQTSEQSLSRLLFVLCSCNFGKRGNCHSHHPFVRQLLAVRFKTLSRTFSFKTAEVEILSKTLGIQDGKEPVGTFTALDTPAFEGLVSVVKFGTETLLPSLDDSEGCATPFGFSKILCESQHLRLLRKQPLPQLQNTAKQALKSQRQSGRSKLEHRNVFGSATTPIRWTGSKWSRPMPTHRNSGEPTTPS